MKISYQYHHVNGVTLHVGHAGPMQGKAMLFLHGFPEFSYSWKKQAAFFAEQGYHVIVPDQRGYNQSSKPSGVKPYVLESLVKDMVALIRELGNERMVLVGHDWGGGVAWTLAQHYPQLVERMIILNMPHLQIMKENLKSNPLQILRSWYAGFFQIPVLPELVCTAFNYNWLAASLRLTSRKGTFTREDTAAYKRAWRQPAAMGSMINWYRAFRLNKLDISQNVTVPTLIIWGAGDSFLSKKMATQSLTKCTDGKLIILEDATHWLHHEKPDTINQLIFEFSLQNAPS